MAIDWATLTAPCKAVFGEPVTYQPADGAAFVINGIFDDAYREVTVAGDGTAVTTDSPILGVQLGDFAAPPLQGDQLTVTRTGETFVVKEVRPDSHGWAVLMLNFVENAGA